MKALALNLQWLLGSLDVQQHAIDMRQFAALEAQQGAGQRLAVLAREVGIPTQRFDGASVRVVAYDQKVVLCRVR